MTVNESGLANTAPSRLGGGKPVERVAERKPGAGPAGRDDKVQLSELSSRLLELASTEPPERTARLERLAAEVRAGRYEPDAAAISRALVDEALVPQS